MKEFPAQLTFREKWTDNRLAYGQQGNESLPPFIVFSSQVEQLWRPDTFFQNEKTAHRHTVDTPNVLMRIYPDGTVLYSVRLSLTFSCLVDLKYYPFDTQTCYMDIASYAYTTKDIDYIWKEAEPVQVKELIKHSMPSFELSNFRTDYFITATNTGNYSSSRVVLEMNRRAFYFLIHFYIPSTLLVIVSWVSFWMHRDAVPARITLGVTTILTMIMQSNGVSAKLPPVAYVKAWDVWIGACLFLIFAALIEYAVVTFVADKRKRRLAKRKAIEERRRYAEEEELGSPAKKPLLSSAGRGGGGQDVALTIDIVSRVVFPLLFALFCAAYFTKYYYVQ